MRILAPLSRLRATLGLQEKPHERETESVSGSPAVWAAAAAEQQAMVPAERQELYEIRERYVRDVTWDDMTISHELGTFLLALCRTVSARRILDLGSGLSSLVFRRYVAGLPAARVWTVDDDASWLSQTATLLRQHDLPTDDLITWPELQREPPGGFDLVFHDLGSIATRVTTLPWVLSHLAPGTPCVLDDTHFRRYWRSVVGLAPQYAVTVTKLTTTVDRYGRFSSGVIADTRA